MQDYLLFPSDSEKYRYVNIVLEIIIKINVIKSFVVIITDRAIVKLITNTVYRYIYDTKN